MVFTTIVTCVTLLAIALAVGLGVGLQHGALSAAAAPTLAPIPTPSPSLKNGILDDTSLAAVTTMDGNRHVFFQDINGSLRHTVFERSSEVWLNDAEYIITSSQPRNLTPLAAVVLYLGANEFTGLFFINTEDLVAAVGFAGSGTLLGSKDLMNSSISVAPHSRTLSVAQMRPSQGNASREAIAEAILLYEAPNHNITTLRGYLIPGFSDTVDSPYRWWWQNVSEAVYSSISSKSNTWLSPPVAAGSKSVLSPQQSICVAYFNLNALSNLSAAPVYLATFDDWTDLREFQGFDILSPSPGGDRGWAD